MKSYQPSINNKKVPQIYNQWFITAQVIQEGNLACSLNSVLSGQLKHCLVYILKSQNVGHYDTSLLVTPWLTFILTLCLQVKGHMLKTFNCPDLKLICPGSQWRELNIALKIRLPGCSPLSTASCRLVFISCIAEATSNISNYLEQIEAFSWVSTICHNTQTESWRILVFPCSRYVPSYKMMREGFTPEN